VAVHSSRHSRTTGHWDACLAFLGLAAVDLMLTHGRFFRVHDALKQWPVARRSRVPEADAIARVHEALDRAAVWYPRQAMCLSRSVVGTVMLRRWGVPAVLVIGVRKVPFYAHAWIEVADHVVNDSMKVRELYPVLERC
jgi:hypothetical protein